MSRLGEDFAKDRSINRFKLEEESEKSPALVHIYADLLADAREALNRQKEKVSYVRGQRNLYWRQNCPANLKPVDSTFTALIESDDLLQAEIQKELNLQADVNALEAVMRSLDHRKSEINNLTKLWLGGYYSVEGIQGSPVGNESSHERMRNAMSHGGTQEEEF